MQNAPCIKINGLETRLGIQYASRSDGWKMAGENFPEAAAAAAAAGKRKPFGESRRASIKASGSPPKCHQLANSKQTVNKQTNKQTANRTEQESKSLCLEKKGENNKVVRIPFRENKMAFNMKLQVASVLIVAVMFALYSANGVSCQGKSHARSRHNGFRIISHGGERERLQNNDLLTGQPRPVPTEGDSSAADKKPAVAAAVPSKSQLAGLPVIVVRQQGGSGTGSSKPDIYLGWLNWDGMSFLRPVMGPFAQSLQPFTQEMSSMLLNALPGASSIYSQFDQVGNQLSGMNPFSQIISQFMGGSSSSSGSGSGSGSSSSSGLGGLPGLSGLSQLFQGRR